jgi:hypothetical protein
LVSQLPDDILARLVGVLPQTIAAARMEMMPLYSPSYSLAG